MWSPSDVFPKEVLRLLRPLYDTLHGRYVPERCVQTLMILTRLQPFNITRDMIENLRSDSMGRIGTATKRSITQRLCHLT
jgi:hypothetical protein